MKGSPVRQVKQSLRSVRSVPLLGCLCFLVDPASAVVDADRQQDAICFVKANAPTLVHGRLPFSCEGKPERFVALVKKESQFLEQTTMVPEFEKCKTRLFEKQSLVNVARGVWSLRDSPVMSTNAAVASSISDACKAILADLRRPQQNADNGYLPWTLDVPGYGPGQCTVTDLAVSFEDARAWARKNSGWIRVTKIDESTDTLSFTYHDGLLKTDAVRTFYKDMQTCTRIRRSATAK